MGFEPRTFGLKGQVASKTDYKIELEHCQAELRLLKEETVQSSDDINTNTLAKNQNGLGGLNQEPEKTEAEKRAEAQAVSASFTCQMVMAICAVLGLIPCHLSGRHVPSTLNLTS